MLNNFNGSGPFRCNFFGKKCSIPLSILMDFLLLKCMNSFHILNNNPLCNMWFTNISSLSLLPFYPVNCFTVQKIISLLSPHLLIFAFVAYAFCVIYQKIITKTSVKELSPMFCSESFTDSDLCLYL